MGYLIKEWDFKSNLDIFIKIKQVQNVGLVMDKILTKKGFVESYFGYTYRIGRHWETESDMANSIGSGLFPSNKHAIIEHIFEKWSS